MKRRDFLKLLTVVPLAPNVLAVVPKEPEKFVGMPDDLCISFGDSDDFIWFDEEPDWKSYTFTFPVVSGETAWVHTFYRVNSEGKYEIIAKYSGLSHNWS